MKYILAIDIGSTHIKACLADEYMNILKISTVKNIAEKTCDCGLCYDSHTLWNRICHVVKEAMKCTRNGSVCAIGVTGMADSGFPVDEYGNELYPVIPWYNNCGFEYKQKVLEEFSQEKLYHITGLCYHPKYAMSRLLFLKDKHPEIFRRMRYWLSAYDFVLYMLTGKMVTDSSQACRSLMYNIIKHDWEKELVNFADVSGRLPDVLDVGQQCGELSAKAAEFLGLSEGIPVICAGHDHLSAMKAVCLDDESNVLNSMGTSEVFVGISSNVSHNPLCIEYGINQGCFSGGKYYWMANLPSSGASVEWLRRTLSHGKPLGYEIFDAEENLISSDDVMYIPHINGSGTPHPNPQNKGALLGLTGSTTIYHIIKAVYEGISYETRWILESIEKAFDISIEKLVAVSGGSRNKPLMKTKADVTGRMYCFMEHSEVTLYGAILQAAEAVGLSPQDHGKSMKGEYKVLKPRSSYKQEYDKKYESYRKLVDLMEQFAKK